MAAHPKVAEYLDAGGKPDSPEFLRTLVVLGPQEHKGKRYEAVDATTNKSVDTLPTHDKTGDYDPTKLTLKATKLAAEK